MSGYELTYRSAMCNPQIYASKFVAIFIFTIFLNSCILLRICFSLQEKQSPAITPPKHMQTLLFNGL